MKGPGLLPKEPLRRMYQTVVLPYGEAAFVHVPRIKHAVRREDVGFMQALCRPGGFVLHLFPHRVDVNDVGAGEFFFERGTKLRMTRQLPARLADHPPAGP